MTRIWRPWIFGFPGPGSDHTKTQTKSRVFASRRCFWRPFRQNRPFRAQDRERVVDYWVSGRQRLRGLSFLGNGTVGNRQTVVVFGLAALADCERVVILDVVAFDFGQQFHNYACCLCPSRGLSPEQSFDFRMFRLILLFLMSSRAPVARSWLRFSHVSAVFCC